MSRRVAVIGAGVSGLVAAREIQRAGHDLVVFEAARRPGGHTNTIAVETEAGRVHVDTGFIVFNDCNYPNFERLLDELGVASQPAPMHFSVSDGVGDFEWSSRPLGVFAKHSHLFDPRFHRMLADLLRFFREGRELVAAGSDGRSLREFCEQRGYSEYFVERLIVPQVSAVWSAPPGQLWSFPVGLLAEFLDNHGALQLRGRPRWRSIVGGSHSYLEPLTAPFADRLRLATPVESVRRLDDGVEVSSSAGVELFDDVVLAVHADQALRMLEDPSRAEREVLGALPYQANDTVLHTDESLMPRRRRAWGSWNFHLADPAPDRTTVTYDMSHLQRLRSDRRFLVTLNRSADIDPAKVVYRATYEHPVYTADGVRARARWEDISGIRGTHYCGAYWGWGFHEDGVVSALRACERIGPVATGVDPVEVDRPLELVA